MSIENIEEYSDSEKNSESFCTVGELDAGSHEWSSSKEDEISAITDEKLDAFPEDIVDELQEHTLRDAKLGTRILNEPDEQFTDEI